MTSDAPIDVEQARARLLALRDELEGLSATGDEAAATVELDQTRVGRLSRMDAMQAQAMSLEAQRRRATTLARIASALQRIDAGAYGDCLRCEEAIDPRRLAVDPAATLCIACAEAG